MARHTDAQHAWQRDEAQRWRKQQSFPVQSHRDGGARANLEFGARPVEQPACAPGLAMRAKRDALTESDVEQVLRDGNERARAVAGATMAKVRTAVGL